MSATIQTRFGAAIVAIAPAVLLAGLVYHPYIPFVPDPAAVAAAAASDTTRWGIAHLVVGVGSGFAVLAFLAVQSYLRAAGTEGLSDLTFPFIVIGSTGAWRASWRCGRWHTQCGSTRKRHRRNNRDRCRRADVIGPERRAPRSTIRVITGPQRALLRALLPRSAVSPRRSLPSGRSRLCYARV